MAWRHNITTNHKRGKVMASCKPCGKQSGWVTPEEALAWAARHVGVKEQKEHARRNEGGY